GPAAPGELGDRAHHRGEPGDGAAAQVVAVGEAAGEDDGVHALEVAVAVPQRDGVGAHGGDGEAGVPGVPRPRGGHAPLSALALADSPSQPSGGYQTAPPYPPRRSDQAGQVAMPHLSSANSRSLTAGAGAAAAGSTQRKQPLAPKWPNAEGERRSPIQGGRLPSWGPNPRAQSQGSKRPTPGTRPARPGNWTLTASANSSGPTTGAPRSSRQRARRARSSRVEAAPAAGSPSM